MRPCTWPVLALLTGTALLGGGAAVASADPAVGAASAADPVAQPAAVQPAATTTTPAPAGPVAPTTPAVPSATAASQSLAPAAPGFSLVGRSRIGVSGAITLVVQAISAGKMTVFGTIPGSVTGEDVATAAAVSAPVRLDVLPLPYGNNAATPPPGQAATITLRPGKQGRLALAKLHGTQTLRVTVTVFFEPAAGGPSTTTTYVVKVGASGRRVVGR